jgi:uncharacterized protein with NAD-binding domain and iron-sulfur cluster
MQGGKEKIAILGGGIAGLTAAFEITSVEGWRDKYEITIYQMGWRLGGKCATGRGRDGRIQEHGLHAFSGSYYNALPMMWDCYQALAEQGTKGVVASFDQAFRCSNDVVIWEMVDGMMTSWPFYVAPNALSPQTHRASLSDVSEIIRGAADFLQTANEKRARRRSRRAGQAVQHAPTRTPWGWLRSQIGALRALLRYLALVIRTGVLGALLRTSWRWLSGRNARGLGDKIRRIKIIANYMLTLRRGIFDPKYNLIEDGFDAIDHLDFRQWLHEHKATPETLNSPLTFNTVDLSYNYPHGDTTQAPKMAAGTYLHWTLRMLLNLGSYAWSFEAGTGETLIAPLYHVLKHRGVRFAFFHKVTALRLADDKASIAAIEVEVQATLIDPESGYSPLKTVKGLACWPAEPDYGQLVDGAQLEDQKIDLESYWAPWTGGSPKVLRAGEDFDKIIYAASVGTVEYLCADLVAHSEAWRRMVDKVVTCATQHVQIWLTDAAGAMGANTMAGTEGPPYPSTLSGTFVMPFNGLADFSHLIAYENWPDPPPKSLWYFSGAMALGESPEFSFHDFPREQHLRVKHQAIQFLQATAGYLLPWAKTDWEPLGLNFSLLRAGGPGDIGLERFDRQFWRANIDPSERYVLCPPGSTKHRLTADGSGFANLVLAGDWIYNGLNVGSVEGAVMGGKLAAHAICAWPPLKSIIGYQPRGSPLYRARAGGSPGARPEGPLPPSGAPPGSSPG